MSGKKYYLGLDIGTDSIGYAVTNTSYDLLKFHGEPAWGVHLFEAANTSAERRAFRTARRRLDRRQQRVKLIRELFAKEVAKIDPRFFIRQEESALFPEDKEERNSLFNDPEYKDQQYHAQFPTIHHLLTALMRKDGPFDVRLVYLACAWLVAHRGHFLNEIDKENVAGLTDFAGAYEKLTNYLRSQDCDIPWSDCDMNAVADALRMKTGVSRKYKLLAAACFGKAKVPKEPTDRFRFNCEVLLKSLCGSTIKAKDLFCTDDYAEVKSFSLGSDDETLAEVMGSIGEDAQLITVLKAVYDWALLVDILNGKETISEAKIAEYDRHHADLTLLKTVIRKYVPEKYSEVFRGSRPDNYVAYSYHGDVSEIKRKVNQADFCAYLKKVISKVKPSEEDAPAFDAMKAEIELGTFMPKQKNTDNRVIPYQLYWYELDIILKRAEAYLPFLCETDEDGLSVSDKIRSVFEFRIPYFVGPLNNHSKHAWIVRKEGKIYPWNFDRMVDLDASEQQFIDRMLGSCSYLPGEPALPKDSMLYHRFMVLNEINNIRVNNVPITVEMKQTIYNDVFMQSRRVTLKRIRDCLLSHGAMQSGDTLSGIDNTVKSDLKPQHDFRRLIQSGKLSEAQAESIIAQRTYCEDAIRFRRWLERSYPDLPAEDIRYLSRLTYKDFGRLSAKFLQGIESVIDPTTGELCSMITAMWNTNLNLMELLSDRFDFMATVEHIRTEYYNVHKRSISDRLDEMYVSNAVKRPILRTLDIVREVMKAFGGAPEKVFVEMARGGTEEQKGKRTVSRRDRLIELYDKCTLEDTAEFRKRLEEMGDSADARLQSDKLYLYFTQLGRCMYSNMPIDLEKLMRSDTSEYNIEHIYPRKAVKDDSVLNNLVLVNSKLNGAKGDRYPVSASIRSDMTPFWKKLKDNNLITEEKYRRLTRATGFTDDEKWGFINRQLTETTQSTKAVATLLKELCPDTEVVYVKARLTSEFRQDFDCIKSRLYNDLHHAKDAYLNIVTGNVYNMRFTRRWFSPDQDYNVKLTAIFDKPLVCNGETVWEGPKMLEKVKRTVHRNNAHMTHYAFTKMGRLFDQMPVKAATGLIPRKAALPTEKYGGYNKSSGCFFMFVRYRSGKKNDIMLMSAELMYWNALSGSQENAINYAKRRISAITGKVIDEVSFPIGRRPIKVGTVFSFDGLRMCVRSKANGGKIAMMSVFMPFVDTADTERYIKRLEKLSEKLSKNPRYLISDKHDLITSEKNMNLYRLYLNKLKSTIYCKRPNTPINILESGIEQFSVLDVAAQVDVLLSIHAMFGRMSGGCDLSVIGGKGNTGTTYTSTNVSSWKKSYSDVRIIDQSASGLWEKQSGNLLELL